MIKSLKSVGIPKRDQDRALEIWVDKIGLEVPIDLPFGEGRWIELTIPGAQTGIALHTPKGHEGRVGTFFNGSFACDDVMATHRTLSDRGVEFVSPPTRQPWGTTATFRDPDGNTFVISGP